jgi:hypothetical protein
VTSSGESGCECTGVASCGLWNANACMLVLRLVVLLLAIGRCRESRAVWQTRVSTPEAVKNLDRQGCNRFRFNIHGHVIFRGLIQVYHIRERAVMRFVIGINSPNNPIRSNPILSESLSSLIITSPGIACYIPHSTTPPITTLISTLYRTLV